MCAGPGGFSEYVLWRKKYGTSKGFGMTLKEDNDFKLEEFIAGPPEYFETYYGSFFKISNLFYQLDCLNVVTPDFFQN